MQSFQPACDLWMPLHKIHSLRSVDTHIVELPRSAVRRNKPPMVLANRLTFPAERPFPLPVDNPRSSTSPPVNVGTKLRPSIGGISLSPSCFGYDAPEISTRVGIMSRKWPKVCVIAPPSLMTAGANVRCSSIPAHTDKLTVLSANAPSRSGPSGGFPSWSRVLASSPPGRSLRMGPRQGYRAHREPPETSHPPLSIQVSQ